ncbi:MAG TPA: hypothetical protein VGI73_07225 [Solirubrobacterales bacterium]|jgi:hypothetical protein
MTLRKRLVGLTACCMFLAMLAIQGVSGAAASTTEECKIPAVGEKFTSKHFLDANCENANTEGEYHTTTVSESAWLIRTNTGIVKIDWEVFASPAEINCATYSGNKFVTSYEKEGVRGFVGEGTMILSGCKVIKPLGCFISEPIKTVPLLETSEDLGEVMRTSYVAKEGGYLATVKVEGCALAGEYSLKGTLRSQSANIHTEEFSATSGSEVKLGEWPVRFTFGFHDATEASGKTVVRELP